MYKQKTIESTITAVIDKKANELIEEGYLFVAPPTPVACNNKITYTQTLVKPIE